MPPTDLANKVVLITGAGSGIGRATAIRLSYLGCLISLSDISGEALDATVSLCTSHLGASAVLSKVFDVGNAEQCHDFVQSTLKTMGRVDCVFNCAGVNPTFTRCEDVTDAYFAKLMDTNVRGTFNITRAVLPHLQSGSSIVNVSSICGLEPGAGFSIYCASKYAVIGFSKSVALEVGERGIRVNILAPGYINTPTNASVVAGQESMDQSAERCAMKRLGRPEEIADVVAFLFSSESSYMSGSVVEIDGGLP